MCGSEKGEEECVEVRGRGCVSEKGEEGCVEVRRERMGVWK